MALDSLRALAAIGIVLSHAGDATASGFGSGQPFTPGFPGKVSHLFGMSFPTGVAVTQIGFCVEIFFVISALLVYQPFIANHVHGTKTIDPIRFFWKRAWRIYPAYWVALFLIVGFSTQHHLANAEQVLTNASLTMGYGSAFSVAAIAALRHAWTLVVEISFYCFVPLWAATMRSLGRRFDPLRTEVCGALALTVLGPTFVWWSRTHSVWTPFRILPGFFGAFGVGMLFAAYGVARDLNRLPTRSGEVLERLSSWFWLAGAALFVVVIKTADLSFGAMVAPGSTSQISERIMHTAVAALVVAPAVFGWRQRSWVGKILTLRVLARIGLWSYGFYLWHYVFIDYMHDHRFDTSSTWFFIKIVVFATVGASAAGALSWYVIERPMMHLGAGSWTRPRWLQWRPPSFYRGLIAITAAALAWRVVYVVTNIGRLHLNGDAFYYHTQANDLAKGRWFIDPSQFAFYGRVTPSAGHPPAYLLYLAAVSRWIGQSELTHRLASTLLGAATVFAVGVFARKLFNDDRAGWLAAGIATIYAHLWINDEMLMSESMAQLWTVVAFIAVYRCWRDPRRGTALWMGTAIGLAAMSRAEAATLFPLLVIPLLLLLRHLSWRRRIGLAAVACIAGSVVMMPWIAFNLGRFAHPVTMSNGIGSVLMVANCDRTYGHHRVPAGEDPNAYLAYWSVGCAIDGGFGPLQKGDESEKEVEWRRVGLTYLKAHKSEFVFKMAPLRVARMWDIGFIGQNVHPFNAELEGRGAWPSTLATMQYIVLMPLALNGLVILRRRKIPILPFLAVAATITITAATTFGITRYRAPVDALLPALAAGAVMVRLRRSKPSPVADADATAEPKPFATPAHRYPTLEFRRLIQSPLAVFVTLALLLGGLFATLTPALAGYDEGAHLWRSWQISDGRIVSETRLIDGVRQPGHEFPVSLTPKLLVLFPLRFTGARQNLDTTQAWRHIRDSAPAGPTKFIGFSQAAVYPPAPYLPSALGFRLGRTIGLSALGLVLMARWAALLAFIAIIGRAIVHIPKRRWLLAALALTPVCLFQSAMISADGITIALSLLVIALAWKLHEAANARLSRAVVGETALVLLALGLSKPPYILFGALLIPTMWRQFRAFHSYQLIVAAAPAVIAFVLWSKYAQSIYVAPQFDTGRGSFAYKGVDAAAQFRGLRTHPLRLVSVIGTTIARTWSSMLHDMVAQIAGWARARSLSAPIAITTFVACAVAVLQRDAVPMLATGGAENADWSAPRLRQRLVPIAIAVATTTVIFALAYAGWNQVAAPRIDEFQGRYLFAPFALLLFALPSLQRSTRRIASWAPAVVVAAASALSLIGLIGRAY